MLRIPALALTVRTLRVDARSPARAMLRTALVAGLLAVLLFSLSEQWRFGAPGLRFFSWLVHIDFWLVTLLGVSAFSGVITEEKEQMTLGLLDLAGFDRISILLGKSLGQLVAAGLLLAVQIPFAVLAITMGGVSTHQVASAFVLLGSWMLLVYGVALLASTVCRRSGSAATLTGVVVGGWLLLPGILEELGTTGALIGMNPYHALWWIAETGYPEPLVSSAVIVDLAWGACGVLAAWLVFRRFNHDEWRAGQARGWFLPRAGARDRGRPRPGPAALAWKDYRFVFGGPFLLLARIVGYPVLLVAGLCCIGPSFSSSVRNTSMLLALWMYFVLLVEYGVVASRFLHEEVKWHTLPALAGLPYPMRTWLWAKVRGSALVLVPITVLLLLDLFLVFCTFRQTQELLFVVLWCGSVVWFAVHFAAWASLVLKRGGFGVAAAAVVVSWLISGFLISTCLFRASGPEGPAVLLSLVYGTIAVGFHRAAYRKLTELSGR